MLLEGGLDWKPIALSPKDMDFIEAKNGAAREIALAFGVPPMLLGIPGDNTYANLPEANRALWRQTVIPLVRRVAEDLAGGWGRRLAASSTWFRRGRGAGGGPGAAVGASWGRVSERRGEAGDAGRLIGFLQACKLDVVPALSRDPS